MKYKLNEAVIGDMAIVYHTTQSFDQNNNWRAEIGVDKDFDEQTAPWSAWYDQLTTHPGNVVLRAWTGISNTGFPNPNTNISPNDPGLGLGKENILIQTIYNQIVLTDKRIKKFSNENEITRAFNSGAIASPKVFKKAFPYNYSEEECALALEYIQDVYTNPVVRSSNYVKDRAIALKMYKNGSREITAKQILVGDSTSYNNQASHRFIDDDGVERILMPLPTLELRDLQDYLTKYKNVNDIKDKSLIPQKIKSDYEEINRNSQQVRDNIFKAFKNNLSQRLLMTKAKNPALYNDDVKDLADKIAKSKNFEEVKVIMASKLDHIGLVNRDDAHKKRFNYRKQKDGSFKTFAKFFQGEIKSSNKDLITMDNTNSLGFMSGHGDMYGRGFYSVLQNYFDELTFVNEPGYDQAHAFKGQSGTLYGGTTLKIGVRNISNYMITDWREFTKTKKYRSNPSNYNKDSFIYMQLVENEVPYPIISKIEQVAGFNPTSEIIRTKIGFDTFAWTITPFFDGFIYTGGSNDGCVLVTFDKEWYIKNMNDGSNRGLQVSLSEEEEKLVKEVLSQKKKVMKNLVPLGWKFRTDKEWHKIPISPEVYNTITKTSISPIYKNYKTMGIGKKSSDLLKFYVSEDDKCVTWPYTAVKIGAIKPQDLLAYYKKGYKLGFYPYQSSEYYQELFDICVENNIFNVSLNVGKLFSKEATLDQDGKCAYEIFTKDPRFTITLNSNIEVVRLDPEDVDLLSLFKVDTKYKDVYLFLKDTGFKYDGNDIDFISTIVYESDKFITQDDVESCKKFTNLKKLMFHNLNENYEFNQFFPKIGIEDRYFDIYYPATKKIVMNPLIENINNNFKYSSYEKLTDSNLMSLANVFNFRILPPTLGKVKNQNNLFSKKSIDSLLELSHSKSFILNDLTLSPIKYISVGYKDINFPVSNRIYFDKASILGPINPIGSGKTFIAEAKLDIPAFESLKNYISIKTNDQLKGLGTLFIFFPKELTVIPNKLIEDAFAISNHVNFVLQPDSYANYIHEKTTSKENMDLFENNKYMYDNNLFIHWVEESWKFFKKTYSDSYLASDKYSKNIKKNKTDDELDSSSEDE